MMHASPLRIISVVILACISFLLIAQFDHGVHSFNLGLPDNIASKASVQFAFNTLSTQQAMMHVFSNKTIVFYGDSLSNYLFVYFVHVFHFCIKNNTNSESNGTSSETFPCPHFCESVHLEQSISNTPPILDACCKRMLTDRDWFASIYRQFDYCNESGFVQRGPLQLLLFDQQYNLTLLLDYKWAIVVSNTSQMLRETVQYNAYNYDIMVHNLLNMHWPLTIRPQGIWNEPFALDMIANMEGIMHDIVEHKPKDALLIFGPVNPVTSNLNGHQDLLRFWKRLQYRTLMHFTMDGDNGNQSDTIYAIIPEEDEYGITEYLRSKHALLAYLKLKASLRTKNQTLYAMIDVNETEVRACLDAFPDAINLCLWYRWTFGQNLIQLRMQQYVRHLNDANVRFLDQYHVYNAFDNLSTYVFGNVHYPQLLPFAFKNLLQTVHSATQ